MTDTSLQRPPSRSSAVQYRRYGGPEVLELVDRATPAPGPDQVLLRVAAASVNPFDGKLRSGSMARTDRPERPVVPGTDIAGVIAELGPGVTAFHLGEEVLGRAETGSYAEYAVADANALIAKPARLSWEQAAALEVIVHTAHAALEDAAVRPGDILVVQGASGAIGTILVQLAVARGVHVIGTARADRLAAVTALGARAVEYGDGLAERVRSVIDEFASGSVPAAVVDLAGKGRLEDLIALTGDPSRVVTVAHPDASRLGARFGFRRPAPGVLEQTAEAVAAGRLQLPAITRYPLAQAAQAQVDNETGRVSGKLVLVP